MLDAGPASVAIARLHAIGTHGVAGHGVCNAGHLDIWAHHPAQQCNLHCANRRIPSGDTMYRAVVLGQDEITVLARRRTCQVSGFVSDLRQAMYTLFQAPCIRELPVVFDDKLFRSPLENGVDRLGADVIGNVFQNLEGKRVVTARKEFETSCRQSPAGRRSTKAAWGALTALDETVGRKRLEVTPYSHASESHLGRQLGDGETRLLSQ